LIDEIDKRLILELQRNGRSSYSDMALKLGLSVTTVYRRVQGLLNDDVIRITAVPNPSKIGDETIGLMGISVDLAKIDEVCAKLVTYDYVHFVGVCFGRFDVVILVHVASTEFLSEFIKNEVSCINGIQKVETLYVTELKKRTYGWLSESETSPDVPSSDSNPKPSRKMRRILDGSK